MLIYKLVFYIYRFFVMRKYSFIEDVWYRNSMSENYFKFLRSDIDITFMIKDGNSEKFKSIAGFHGKAKKIFRILGEISLFDVSVKEDLFYCINPYELMRDRILSNKLIGHASNFEAAKLIFLVRFLISNFGKENELANRKEKLDYYFQLCDIPDNFEKSYQGIVNYLGSFTNLERDEFEFEFNKIIESDFKNIDFEINSWIYVLFFHHLNYLCLEISLNDFQKELVAYSARWEVWGCYSNQMYFPKDKLDIHLRKLTRSLRFCGLSSEADKLNLIISKIIY